MVGVMTDQTTASFGFTDIPASEKASRVRGVFDAVASKYDVMNDLMSGGLHRAWKDAMVARLNPQPGETFLDLAGGTGDVARRIKKLSDAAVARRGGPAAHVTIIDINEEMIRAGKAKGEGGLSWLVGDAEKLPVPDRYADAYTISFGIRNVTDIPAALREARRALKPGGRFACLEFSKPTTGALEAIYDLWSFKAIPPIGKLVTGDSQPYQYLVESIRRFPDQETFKGMIGDAGFKRVDVTNFAGGIVALHTGWAL